MANQLTTGVKITVDASDIQNKFTKSVDQLNASLSKNQKALGLVYNEQGILTNALGQTVEGLSQSAIKLGQYVDELGRVRTYQGGFIDGLSKTQIELGQYADELGNVYNKLGDLIGQTEKACKAQEAQAQEAERAAAAQANAARSVRDSLAHSAEGISKVAGQFAIFQQLLQQSGASSDAFGASVAKTANAISVATGSFKASVELINGLSEATRAVPSLFASTAQAAAKAAPALAAVGTEAAATGVAMSALGGPVTLAVSTIAALTAGLVALNATKAKEETVSLSASFEELERKAARAGATINSLADALKVGAFASASTDIENASAQFLKANDALKKAAKDYEELKKRADENAAAASAAAGRYVASSAPDRADFMGKFETEFKNSVAEYNAVAAKYVDAARAAQKTEEQKINEQRKAYAALLKVAEKIGDDENANLFKAQIDLLDGQILEARKKQAQEAENAAKQEREKVLANAGVAEYLKRAQDAAKGSAESLDAYKAKLEEWRKLAKAGTLSADELEKAEKGLADEFQVALAKRLGVSLIDAQEQTVDAFAELAAALKEGAISQKQYDAMKKGLEQKELAAIASRLGVTFDDKKELDYTAKIDELNKLLAEKKITQEQFNAATKQLKEQELASLGVEDQTATASYNKRVKELEKALQSGIIAQKDYDRMVNDAKTKLASSIGVSADEIKAYEKRRAKIESDYEKGLIDATERDRRLNNASKKLEKARDDAAKKAEKEREKQDIRGKLGVDALLESMKSPVQKYRETLDQIAAALKKHAINANEADALRMQAMDAYLKTMESDAQGADSDATGREQSAKKNEPAKSYTSGSEDLYLAQVRNSTASYQSAIQTTTAAIAASVAQTAEATNLNAYYLRELIDAQGNGVQIWG